ncbi:MAG: type II secretion system F family protein, partial [Planctomycetota bacterium]
MLVFIAQIVSPTFITQAAIFGFVAAAAWWGLDFFARRKPRAEQRLDEFREPNSRKSDLMNKGKGKQGAVAKVLEKASPKLSAPLQPKSTAEVGKTKQKLNTAGFRGENAPQVFFALKTLGLAVGFLLSGGALGFTRGFDFDT